MGERKFSRSQVAASPAIKNSLQIGLVKIGNAFSQIILGNHHSFRKRTADEINYTATQFLLRYMLPMLMID